MGCRASKRLTVSNCSALTQETIWTDVVDSVRTEQIAVASLVRALCVLPHGVRPAKMIIANYIDALELAGSTLMAAAPTPGAFIVASRVWRETDVTNRSLKFSQACGFYMSTENLDSGATQNDTRSVLLASSNHKRTGGGGCPLLSDCPAPHPAARELWDSGFTAEQDAFYGLAECTEGALRHKVSQMVPMNEKWLRMWLQPGAGSEEVCTMKQRSDWGRDCRFQIGSERAIPPETGPQMAARVALELKIKRAALERYIETLEARLWAIRRCREYCSGFSIECHGCGDGLYVFSTHYTGGDTIKCLVCHVKWLVYPQLCDIVSLSGIFCVWSKHAFWAKRGLQRSSQKSLRERQKLCLG